MRIAVDTSSIINLDPNTIAFGVGVLTRLPSIMDEVIFVFNDDGVPSPYPSNVEQVYEYGASNAELYFSIDGHEHYEMGPGVISVLSLDSPPAPIRPWWPLFGKPRDYFAEGLARAKSILVPHSSLRKTLLDGYNIPPDRIKVVGHGLSERSITPADPVTRRITKEVYGKEHSFFYAPATGRESDNLARLFVAYDLFRARCPEPVQLLVQLPQSGGKHSRAVRKAQKKAKYHADIVFLPRLSAHEHRNVFSSARAVLYPSLSTAFPLPVLDAWTAEVPVLYTDNDILQGAGALVRGEDVKSIAEGMVALVTTPFLASGLVENGKRRRGDFSWERVAERVAEVLREVAAQV